MVMSECRVWMIIYIEMPERDLMEQLPWTMGQSQFNDLIFSASLSAIVI